MGRGYSCGTSPRLLSWTGDEEATLNRSLSVAVALAVAVAGLAVPASASAVAPCRFGIRDDQIQIRYDYLGGRPVLGCPVSGGPSRGAGS